MRVIIVGGGAAGFFAAIRCAELRPDAQVTILERGRDVLGKVKISGGGRCNVTHACYVPRDLIKFYPRGAKELLGPFNRFACGDTQAWFEDRGVPLKIEEDGRIFPVSNRSSSIMNCLIDATHSLGVKVVTQKNVTDIIPPENTGDSWGVHCQKGEVFAADKLMIASGSNHRIWQLLGKLGHEVVSPAPSLFTFNIKDSRIQALPGVSVPLAEINLPSLKLKTRGPILITHWGLSGPAILKLSAWGARALAERRYEFEIVVNWLADSTENVQRSLNDNKHTLSKKKVSKRAEFGIPNRLWLSLLRASNISAEANWADLNKKQMQELAQQLTAARFQVKGKSTNKEEFVTAGGIQLKEINFKSFSSKVLPNLFMAGEVLNIDALTGGFNFQAAWTGGWIAGEAMSQD